MISPALYFLPRKATLCFFLGIWFAGSSHGAAQFATNIQEWLQRSLLETNQPLEQVQAFTEKRVPTLPSFQSANEFESYAKDLREEILREVVFRGKAQSWRHATTRVEWLDTIKGGPGYHIRKLRYEALPGLWIPALLYEPDLLTEKTAAILNVNGHDGKGKAADYKQLRCINLAKRGCLALNVEWLGMGQLSGENYVHYRMNQLDLCGASGLAPFYLAMARALDVLLAHEKTDPERVAVTGLSGGGWQTILISSLDTRVKLANPVAGYSSFKTRARYPEDLGDSEQTPNDLAAYADYTHLTALLAPRPALLTFNEKDNCCFASGHALTPLWQAAQPVYSLFNRPEALSVHINSDPGDHNFGVDNRQAFYAKVEKHFLAGRSEFSGREIPSEQELKTVEDLTVPLPNNNHHFNSLAKLLAQELPGKPDLPTTKAEAIAWQEEQREVLENLVYANPYRISPKRLSSETNHNLIATHWRLQIRRDWTLPAIEIRPLFIPPTGDTVILIHDQGRKHLEDRVKHWLDRGRRVVAVDLFYFGESAISRRDFLYALLVAAIGERPLGVQASQLSAVARWAQTSLLAKHIVLETHGERSSLIGLVAAAMEDKAISEVNLHQSLGSLKEIIERNESVNKKPEWFCFGLLERFDILHMAALVGPRPLNLYQSSDRARSELKGLKSWYALLGYTHDPLSD